MRDLHEVISSIRYENIMNELRSRKMNEGKEIYKDTEVGYRMYVESSNNSNCWFCQGDPLFKEDQLVYKTLEELNSSLQPIENQMELFDLKEVMDIK